MCLYRKIGKIIFLIENKKREKNYTNFYYIKMYAIHIHNNVVEQDEDAEKQEKNGNEI